MSIFTSVDNEEATPGSMVSLRAGRSKWGDIQYRSERTSSWRWHLKITVKKGGGSFPGGPLANSLASNAGDAGSIPGWGSKLAYTAEQLSPCATTREPTCCKYWSPNALGPVRRKERPLTMKRRFCVLRLRLNTAKQMNTGRVGEVCRQRKGAVKSWRQTMRHF